MATQKYWDGEKWVEVGGGGAVVDTEKNKYFANFDKSMNTFTFKDSDFYPTFLASFNQKFNFDNSVLDPTKISFQFFHLKDNLHLTYGVVNNGGYNNLYYFITNVDTKEVVKGGVVPTAFSISLFGINYNEFTTNDKHIFIRLNRAGSTALAVFDINTFEFLNYVVLTMAVYAGNIVNQISVTNDNVACFALSTGSTAPSIIAFPMQANAQGVPTSTIKSVTYGVGIGSTAGQAVMSVFTDGSIFFISVMTSGGAMSERRLQYNHSTSTFVELSHSPGSFPVNPSPPAVLQFMYTYESGSQMLVRLHHGNSYAYLMGILPSTGARLFLTYLNYGSFSYMFDGSDIYYSNMDTSKATLIGNAYYTPIFRYYPNPGSYTMLSEDIYVIANPPQVIGGTVGLTQYPTAHSIVSDGELHLSSGWGNFFKMERVYNLINYTKEVKQ